MRLLKLLGIVGLMLGAAACESHQMTASTQDQPVLMSQSGAPRTGYITPEMRRFDAGIGDTTLQIGGGGNAD